MKVYIKENSRYAFFAAKKLKGKRMAMVLGNTIHLYKVSREDFLKEKSWVCHEVRHILQFKQHGYLPFLFKYLIEWMKHGYINNRFEIEANESENDLSLLDKVQFV
ncbi:MAG TPA: DUF4157 domain-containing protein [Chitinophagaceae bacterium]|nr:DUF4157 domain-containing protein [Chitinophagaceae bacterium]